MKTLALIPHYNHPSTISHVAQTMRGFGLNVLIVDDGSREECKPVLQALVSDGIDVLYRPINGGKGAAVKTGLEYAQEHGYTHVLQVDADGQHCLSVFQAGFDRCAFAAVDGAVKDIDAV